MAMLKRVNKELLVKKINHPEITLNQMKNCVARAIREEKRVIFSFHIVPIKYLFKLSNKLID